MKAWKQLKNKYGLLGFLALLLVLCTLLGVLFTQARYVEEAVSGSDIYDGDMEYIVAEQVEVESVEELIAAIENGYSNIKIADSVDNPLIITSGVTDVGTDLILDLNGHEIQRNNRDPMLNIENGVRLTIIDTSSQQEGSFYNPVGSVLQIGGGTLTVSAGAFISGPKKSEYAHEDGSGGWTAGSEVQSDDGLFALGGEGGTIDGKTADVTLYVENGGIYTGSEGSVSMPVITPFIRQASYAVGEEEQTYWFVNGNMYFDGDAENSLFGTGYGGVIMGDTYLYHVLDDSSVTGTQIAVNGAADFYYTYNVERTEDENGEPRYTYTLDEADGERVFAVTVYGYHRVKASADAAASYATVKMLAGNMYVRGGSYTTNFGKATAYGVYASGGYMSVEAGSFEAIEGGVCIECAYTANSDEEYLRVADGSFRSDNGDTIRVSGGRMVVTGGAFYKDDSDSSVPSDQQVPAAGEPGYLGAIIRVTGGSLTATGSLRPLTFGLTGSSQYGVYAENGTVTLTNAALTFAEGAGSAASYNTGVYATGAESSVTLTDTQITVPGINGKGNYGVDAAANIALAGSCSVAVQGSESGGLLAQGGNISYEGGGETLTVSLEMKMNGNDASVLDSTAVAALNGGITLAGRVNVTTNGIGVAVWSEGEGSAANSFTLTSGALTINSARSTALYVSGGNVTFGKGTEVAITSESDNDCRLTNGNALFNGVFVQGGTLVADGTFNVTHTGAGAAVCVQGNATFGGAVTVTKNAAESYPSVAALYDAVHIESGSMTVKAEFTVTHSGIGTAVYVAGNITLSGTAEIEKNAAGYESALSVQYDSVRVEGGEIKTEADSSFTVTHGGIGAAVYVAGGDVTFGGSAQITKNAVAYGAAGVRYDGIYLDGGSLTVSGSGMSAAPNFTVTHGGIGAAVYVADGSLTLNGFAQITNDMTGVSYIEGADVSYDGVYVGGTLDASKAVFNVTHTGVNNDYSGNYDKLVVRSYAVRVEGGADSKVTIGSGRITNSVGGGLYVNGGTVEVGTAGDDGEAGSAQLTISATGSGYDGTWYDTNGNTADGLNAWHYHKNISGGHAVEVVGGTLTIKGGRYTANMGNGILVQNGTATVESGTFIGADAYTPSASGSAANAGPAASYAFKLYGGTLTVNGGTFTDQKTDGTGSGNAGSGAFVMGGASQAQVIVNAGIFNVQGTAAFAVYSNASVTFGSESNDSDEDIQLSAESAAITVEDTNGNSNSVVNINSGTYWCNSPKSGGGSDGIFYGEGTTELNIRGGVFSGVGDPDTQSGNTVGRSGIYFADDPGGSVKLSGGRFIGGQPTEGGSWGRYYWYNGGALSTSTTTGWLGNINGVSEYSFAEILEEGYQAVQYGTTSVISTEGGPLIGDYIGTTIAQYRDAEVVPIA